MYKGKKSHGPLGFPNRHQGCKGIQRHEQRFLQIGLVSHDNKPHNYTYIEGPSPLYISYLSPEQTRQDKYQDTLESAGDKGQRRKNVTKVNESKQCMEGGLQS